MYRSGMQSNSTYYKLSSYQAMSLVQQASDYFKVFLEENKLHNDVSATKALNRSLETFQDAISASVSQTDKGFCKRRYATAVIRNSSQPLVESHTLAKKYLLESIEHFEQFGIFGRNGLIRDTMVLELQRALVLLGQVALALKDGQTLQYSTDKLFEYLKRTPNPPFEFEALTYLYHIQMSANKPNEALETLKKAIKFGTIYNLNNDTHFRHLAKVYLCQFIQNPNMKDREIFFAEKVIANFERAFKSHKYSEVYSKSTKKNHLSNDYCLLLNIKIVEKIYGIDGKENNESLYDSLKQRISGVNQQNILPNPPYLNSIRAYIELIKKQEGISFAFKLFENEPQKIAISAEQFEELFPDYNDFMIGFKEQKSDVLNVDTNQEIDVSEIALEEIAENNLSELTSDKSISIDKEEEEKTEINKDSIKQESNYSPLLFRPQSTLTFCKGTSSNSSKQDNTFKQNNSFYKKSHSPF